MHYVVLTYMGKFHVRNVNESRNFQYLRVVVRKDVAPCGGLCPKSFIKNRFSPYFYSKIQVPCVSEKTWTATKKLVLRFGTRYNLILKSI